MGFYLNKCLLDLKQTLIMHSNTDYNTTTFLRKTKASAGASKSKSSVNQALRRGGDNLETRQKFSGGTNRKTGTDKNTMKLDQETEELRVSTVSFSVGRWIQKGRQQKNMTQKELAAKINEKAQVINEYENGKAIPNNQVMGKIERAIGIKLRGKDKGTPLVAKPAKNNFEFLLTCSRATW